MDADQGSPCTNHCEEYKQWVRETILGGSWRQEGDSGVDLNNDGYVTIHPAVQVPVGWSQAQIYTEAFYDKIDELCTYGRDSCADGNSPTDAQAVNGAKGNASIAAGLNCPDGTRWGTGVAMADGFMVAAEGGEGPAGGSGFGGLRSKGSPCAKCFLAGTDVLMADGTTNDIEDIEPGDKVQATDPETGESGAREVTRLIVTQNDKHSSPLRRLPGAWKNRTAAARLTAAGPDFETVDRRRMSRKGVNWVLCISGRYAHPHSVRLGGVGMARARRGLLVGAAVVVASLLALVAVLLTRPGERPPPVSRGGRAGRWPPIRTAGAAGRRRAGEARYQPLLAGRGRRPDGGQGTRRPGRPEGVVGHAAPRDVGAGRRGRRGHAGKLASGASARWMTTTNCGESPQRGGSDDAPAARHLGTGPMREARPGGRSHLYEALLRRGDGRHGAVMQGK
ncbi:hypothetical protein [Streptomyces scabiei]|uniref:Hom_end-associated Hint n=1 Tax=Streptomyces scabiei TaxID=1930 RepID=A0A117EFB1_STRSC|nr:hypothetical protein [Streptomyces scabiei]GAQ65288.1 Hom_end-associated Hint [Streptomyces scabiei]